jgi:hypothetical protein
MDPLEVINTYKSCPYHPTKSKLESLELGCVWKFNTGNNLNGAHDSLVDAKAQTDIIIHKHFPNDIDRTKSIRLVTDIFSQAEQREMVTKMEPLRGVHKPWFEVVEGDGFSWTPPEDDCFTGAFGGGACGPSSSILQIARTGSLAKMFLHIIGGDETLDWIVKRTNDYAYKDWVVPSPRLDRDGNPTKRPILTPVFVKRGQTLPSNARHCWKPMEGERQYDVSKSFVIAWFGILISTGALFSGDNNRGINAIYKEDRYGIAVPYIQNTMTKKAFTFMRNFIHFSKTKDQKQRGERGYDPLFKISHITKLIMKGIRGAWVAGDKITIDESMIRYMGRAVAFIQYMPRRETYQARDKSLCCLLLLYGSLAWF